MTPVETSCPILLGCRQTELHLKRKATYTHLMTAFVNAHLLCHNKTMSETLQGRQTVVLFTLEKESKFTISLLFYFWKPQKILHQRRRVPCCLQRICRWLWRKSLQPAARTSFCLAPKSYRPTPTWVGWLKERRGKEMREEEWREGGEEWVRQVMQKQVRGFFILFFLDQMKKRNMPLKE